jgi:hypothetical protein
MSIATRITDLATRIATEFKSVYSKQGILTSLSTTDKTSLVSAINEVKLATQSATGINDAATSAASTWSSTKVNAEIVAAKNALLGGASAAYDTLQEIQTLMQNDDTQTTNILASLGNRLRFDGAQVLSAPQQAQAQTNLNVYSRDEIGDPATDFVALFNTALL